MKYYIYILRSQKQQRYYIGCSKNIPIRLKAHNAGRTKSTKPYRPWILIYYEAFSFKSEAYKREWHLKHPCGYAEKNKIIQEYGEVA